MRLLSSRRFGSYFAGNAISASGLWFHNLAAGILLYRMTGSALALGALAVTQYAPTLLLVSVAGRAADRFERKRVLVVTEVSAATLAGTLALLVAVGAATPAVVLALSFGLGVVQAFTTPTAAALVPALVDPRDLPTAVALNSLTFNLARAVGPGLGALVIGTAGIAAAMAVNAVSYLALVAGILVARPSSHTRDAATVTRLRDTIADVWAHPRMRVCVLVVLVVSFAADPVNTLAPAFAVSLGRPDTDAGLIVGAFGVGAVVAALSLAGRPAGSRLLGGLLLTLGTAIALFSASPGFGLALAACVVAGFGFLSATTIATSRLQLDAADAQRGRIMALWGVAFIGLRPVASTIDSWLASVFDVHVAGAVLALPAVVVGALVVAWRGWPRTLRAVEAEA